MKKYLVTRSETWTWSEEFEAEDAQDLQAQLEDYDWELPPPSEVFMDESTCWCELEEEEVENV